MDDSRTPQRPALHFKCGKEGSTPVALTTLVSRARPLCHASFGQEATRRRIRPQKRIRVLPEWRMRAVADTESPSVSEVPDPIAGPGEVVIDVVAAGSTADLLQRRGAYPPPARGVGDPGAGGVGADQCGRPGCRGVGGSATRRARPPRGLREKAAGGARGGAGPGGRRPADRRRAAGGGVHIQPDSSPRTCAPGNCR